MAWARKGGGVGIESVGRVRRVIRRAALKACVKAGVKAVVLPAVLAAIAMSTATALPLPVPVRAALKTACSEAPQAADPAADIDALAREQPLQAWALACQRGLSGEGADSLAAAADAAAALQRLQRDAAAAPLLDALEPLASAGDAPARFRVAWHWAKGQQAARHGEVDKAGRHYEAAAQQLALLADPPPLLLLRLQIASVHVAVHRRQLDAGELAARRARERIEALGLQRSLLMADWLDASTELAYARQDWPGALAFAQQQAALYRDLGLGEDPQIVQSLASAGALLYLLNRTAEARAVLGEGLLLVERHPLAEPQAQMALLNNLSSHGNADPGCRAQQRSVDAARRLFGPEHPRQVRSLMHRSLCQLLHGRYAESLAGYADAQRLAERHPDEVSLLTRLELHDGMAHIHTRLVDDEAAQAQIERGLVLVGTDPALGYWRGRMLRRRSVLSSRAERWTAAAAEHREAAELMGAALGARHPLVLELHAERCVAEVRGKLPTGGCDLLRDAGPALVGASSGYRSRVHSALAIEAEDRGDGDTALRERLMAVAAAQSEDLRDPLWSALAALAEQLWQRGQHQLALLFGKEAIAATEALRAGITRSAPAERGFLSDKLRVYRQLAAWLAAEGRLDEAVDTLRLLKEEEFYNFMQRDGGLVDARRRTELTPLEQQWRERWRALPAPGGNAAADQAWLQQAERLLGELSRGAPTLRPAALQPPADPPPAGVLRVTGLATADELLLVLDSQQGRQVSRQRWAEPDLAREIGELLATLDGRDDALPALRRLYGRIGAPMAEAAVRVGATRIELHLDGALRYLPFAALNDGQRYLAQRFTLVHRVGGGGRPAVASAPAVLKAFGTTRAASGLAPLAGVAEELCGIVGGPVRGLDGPTALRHGCSSQGTGRGAWRGEAWVDEQFTAQRLATSTEAPAGGTPALLHVGTHFQLRPGNVARSWLLLGDGSRLHLSEMAQMRFDGSALVTLSACETGRGSGQADGREVDGLSMIVLRRGAAAVMASLWRVDDGSTSALMQDFYRELRRGDPAQALQRAQLRMIGGATRQSAARHWAGFYVTQP